jgi:uncharacterized membrane protein
MGEFARTRKYCPRSDRYRCEPTLLPRDGHARQAPALPRLVALRNLTMLGCQLLLGSRTMIRPVIAFLLALLMWPALALAEKRVALVIGNSAYAHVGRLVNPTRDADAMEALFRTMGFEVVEANRDLGLTNMRKVLRDFTDRVRDADIAVVFYAGHGIEVGGVNYLIPIDAALERDIDVEDETIPVERVMQILEQAKRLRLIILDACRDNPFLRTMRRTLASRSVGSRGLAEVRIATADTMVAFAAKAGSTAADGQGANSPYTRALIKHLPTPGLDVRLAFGKVRDEVLESTGKGQEPSIYGSLGGSEILLVSASTPRVQTTPAQPTEAERAWASIKDSKDVRDFQTFRRIYGKSNPFYDDQAARRIDDLNKQAATAKAQAEAEARRRQEEAKQRADAEAKKAEQEAAAKAETKRQQEEKAKRADEEAKRQTEIAAKKKAEQEAAAKALAAAEGKRKADEAAAKKRAEREAAAAMEVAAEAKRQAERDAKRQADEVARKEKAEQEALEAKRKTEAKALGEAERAWAAVRDTRSRSILETYIDRFGSTVYGEMARARLEELKKQQRVAVAAQRPAIPPTGDGLNVCNHTSNRVGVAIAYQDAHSWKSEGWWNLAPNSCQALYRGRLKNRYYYIHAVDYDEGGSWEGSTYLCMGDKVFTIENAASQDCDKTGHKKAAFFEVDTGQSGAWTVKLDPAKK